MIQENWGHFSLTYKEVNAFTNKVSFQLHANYSVYLLLFYVEELENLLKVILNVDKNITVWQVNKVLRKVSSPFLI